MTTGLHGLNAHILRQQSTHSTQIHMGRSPILDHVLDHKSELNRYKKRDIIPCIFSDHRGMEVDVNHGGGDRKTTNT